MSRSKILAEEFADVPGVRVWRCGMNVYVEMLAPSAVSRRLAWSAFESAADRAALELSKPLSLEGMGRGPPEGYEKVG